MKSNLSKGLSLNLLNDEKIQVKLTTFFLQKIRKIYTKTLGSLEIQMKLCIPLKECLSKIFLIQDPSSDCSFTNFKNTFNISAFAGRLNIKNPIYS